MDPLETYRTFQRRWQIAAAFWLTMWYLFAVGGLMTSAMVAAFPAALKSSGAWDVPLAIASWFTVTSITFTTFVRPWRFHRAYQAGVYDMEIALLKAKKDPEKSAPVLDRTVERAIRRIQDAGSDIDDRKHKLDDA